MPTQSTKITDRQRQVLEAVVAEHVRTAAPVAATITVPTVVQVGQWVARRSNTEHEAPDSSVSIAGLNR